MVIAVFMLIFSVNFNLYISSCWAGYATCCTMRSCAAISASSPSRLVTMGINIADRYGGFIKSAAVLVLQCLTISSSTGFGTADFTRWPQYSQSLIVILMLYRRDGRQHGRRHKAIAHADIYKDHSLRLYEDRKPRMVKRCGHKRAAHNRDTVRAVYVFCALYALILVTGTLLVSFDGYDMTTDFTAVISCLSNIGPRPWPCGQIRGQLCDILAGVKLIFTFIMLAGRLEVLPAAGAFCPVVLEEIEIHRVK